MAGDEITLTLPRKRGFFGVAHLVLGGLAVRLDLTFDSLDDLQLAVERLLEQDGLREEVTLTLLVDGDTVRAVVGPFADGGVTSALERGASDLSLRRILDTVVDDVGVDDRSGELWVTLTKRVRAARA